MKLRFLFSLLLGATLAASAQGGYQDGVDNYNMRPSRRGKSYSDQHSQ